MFKLFKFKQNKVFTKLNKMNRKQAYTIGAVAVVLIVALILVISSATGEDDSFAGMDARGYDLAQMPFATDEAEQYLLSNVYPDMQENGSSLLYSLQEKEERQEEDERTLDFIDNDEEDDDDTDYTGDSDNSYNSDSSYNSGSSRGYGGYGGYGGRGGGGKTEIGTLSSAGMATSGGGGINSTYGPSGDFHQFKGREDRGDEKPVQLKTNDAKQTLAQFRSGSLAAARLNENKMKNAGKALFGGDIRGSDAFGKDGSVDLSKLQSGGLSLDTSAPSTTTDLNNLDKKVAEAAKNAQDKKKEEDKKKWWEEMLIDLAKSSAKLIVDSFLGTAMDTLSANISASNARRGAKNDIYNGKSDELYALACSDTPEGAAVRADAGFDGDAKAFKEKYPKPKNFHKQGVKLAKQDSETVARANDAGTDAWNEARGFAAQQQTERAKSRNKDNNDDYTQAMNQCIQANKTWDATAHTCK